MDLDRNFAVEIRNEEESRAVQERFFEMRVFWPSVKGLHREKLTRGRISWCIGFNKHHDASKPGVIRQAERTWYRSSGWPILTASEFLVSGKQTMMLVPKGVK